ncbi:MAG: AMP-binding protein [Rhizobiaceae bacterium]
MVYANPTPSKQDRKKDDPEVVMELLRIVHSVAKELHPHLRPVEETNLDSDLERDVGLDSLGRAELVLRLNKAFKVRLPDQLLEDADSPRDLLTALQAAGPQTEHLSARALPKAAQLPRIEIPSTATTLIEALDFHVRAHGDRPHLQIWIAEGEDDRISYAKLHDAAREVAFGLIDARLTRGERVGIMLGTDAAFFEAFIGTLYAGGIPVPMYPPFRRSQVEDHLRRQAGILRNAQASFLIIGEDMQELGSLLFGLTDDLKHIQTVAKLRRGGAIDAPLPVSAKTTALIQYTSGSTGDPKGVVLTHANLLANIRAMGTMLEASSADVFVSWLPLYHDMGLIGAWLGSLYYGAYAIIMPPLAFLADPARWLRTISRNRATLSAAPNFAFELCCKNIRDEDIVGLDLGSLRIIVNGAEPVSPLTIKRFSERFSSYGFQPEMLGPVYGLAENSVGLAFPPIGRAPIVDRISRSALSRDGVARPTDASDETALTFVACGRPIPHHEIRIVDDADHELPERMEGRLQFKGPSATAGYFRNQEKNRTLFCGEWLESGERAYVASGDVYITGRIKDMIIKAGRNLYPQEIEGLVGEIEGVRKGCVAAIASKDSDTGTEKLVLLVETRLMDPQEKEQLIQRINESCTVVLDMPPDVIELVPPRTVPKTSSGKIRRAAARALFEAGLPVLRERRLRMQLIVLAISGIRGQARRLLRRIGGLAYACYWWVLLVTLAAISWMIVMVLPKREWRHFIVYITARWFLWLTGLALRLNVVSELPAHSAVLVANHSSYLDSLVVVAAFPGNLTFVAKEELARQWIAGPFLKRLGTLFVRRALASEGLEDIETQLAAARAGERVVSFPEGTLMRMPGLLGFHLGPFLIAAKSDRPVVPIAINGTRSILRGGQWFPRHGNITVHIGEPLMSEGSDFSAAVRLRDDARSIILAASGEPDLVHEQIVIKEV